MMPRMSLREKGKGKLRQDRGYGGKRYGKINVCRDEG